MRKVDIDKLEFQCDLIGQINGNIYEMSCNLHFRKSLRPDLVLIDILEQDADRICLDASSLVCRYKYELNDGNYARREAAENDYENIVKKLENYWIKILNIEMFFEEWTSVKKVLIKNETWSFIKERATYISPYKY